MHLQRTPKLDIESSELKRRVRRLAASFEKKLDKSLTEEMGQDISELEIEKGSIKMRVDRNSILKLCTLLRDKHGFDHLSLVTAVDRIEDFELVYHIYSYPRKTMVEIKVSIPKDDPRVQSVTPLWGGANWHEREAYDMMGIVFENHPDPRRILLPQEYEYFPLRKDFKMDTER